MINRVIIDKLILEASFRASRSSGAGGQHVNKVSSRVELRFDIQASAWLSDEQKSRLIEKLASRITRQGELILVSDKTRSQHKNKEDCVERFKELLNQAFKPGKKRVPTRPSKASRLKRIEKKKQHAQKKEQRRKPGI
ncbi:MAG: aminoacyl-tRNA hydrolase [Bacteroidetes bacterium]|nr:MAG: aminoacyl-tRNA hydrolase [Bacteroidota bacterium]